MVVHPKEQETDVDSGDHDGSTGANTATKLAPVYTGGSGGGAGVGGRCTTVASGSNRRNQNSRRGAVTSTVTGTNTTTVGGGGGRRTTCNTTFFSDPAAKVAPCDEGVESVPDPPDAPTSKKSKPRNVHTTTDELSSSLSKSKSSDGSIDTDIMRCETAIAVLQKRHDFPFRTRNKIVQCAGQLLRDVAAIVLDPDERERICNETMATIYKCILKSSSRLGDPRIGQCAQQFLDDVCADIRDMIINTGVVKEGYDGLDSTRDTIEQVLTAFRFFPQLLSTVEARITGPQNTSNNGTSSSLPANDEGDNNDENPGDGDEEEDNAHDAPRRPRVDAVAGDEDDYDITARALLKKEGFDPEDVSKKKEKTVIDGPPGGPSAVWCMGVTPIQYFCFTGNLRMCQYLVFRRGADCRTTSEYGLFALFWAARGGHLEIVQFLCHEGGAHDDIQRQIRYGLSPLRIALVNDHFHVAQWLTLNGALESSRDDLAGGGIDDEIMRRDLRQGQSWRDDKRLPLLLWAQDVVTDHDNFQLVLTGTILFPDDEVPEIFELIAQYVGGTLQQLRTLRQLIDRLGEFIDDVRFVIRGEEDADEEDE